MAPATLLAFALAATAGDPCVGTDARGRTFRVCFDPGNGLELSLGGAWGRQEPLAGGASEVRAAWRWRGDQRSGAGDLEWLRDMDFVDARAIFVAGETEPREARGLAWRGTFVRHRTSPFLLVPVPRPMRVPFPFDVGFVVEVGGVAWDASARRDLRLAPFRSALLLDLGGHGVIRRLAFGPEVAWAVHVPADGEAVHGIVPFTAGVVDARLESRDGLTVLALVARGGSVVSVPGGTDGFLEATAALERTVLAVNDRPVAIYLEGSFRGGASRAATGGASGRGASFAVGLRTGLGR